MNIQKYVSLCIFLLSALVQANSQTDNISTLREALKDVCLSPDQAGKFFEINATGSAGVKVKFIDLKVEGDVKKSDWDGVQKVLKEQQHKDNADFRQCIKEILPTFVQLLPTDGETITKDPTETECYSENDDYKDDSTVKKSIKCLDNKTSGMEFDLGPNFQKQGILSARFNGCEPYDNHKKVRCSVVLRADENTKVTLYINSSDYAPSYFDDKFDSRGAYFFSIKEKGFAGHVESYNMLAGNPINIKHDHKNTKNKITSYLFNVGLNGEVLNFKFSAKTPE